MMASIVTGLMVYSATENGRRVYAEDSGIEANPRATNAAVKGAEEGKPIPLNLTQHIFMPAASVPSLLSEPFKVTGTLLVPRPPSPAARGPLSESFGGPVGPCPASGISTSSVGCRVAR